MTDQPIYRIEARNSVGDLIAILENASRAAFDKVISRLHTASFRLPSDDLKVAYLSTDYEFWIYYQGLLLDIYKMVGRRSIRD